MSPNPRISCIMPSLLKERPGSTKNPEKKFVRAVRSFLDAHRNYPNSQLIVISDGCSATNRIVSTEFKEFLGGAIKLFKLPPRPDGSLFVGSTRQYGIDRADGDILCNLDADDYIMPNHLKNIAVTCNPATHDWWWHNCIRKLDNLKDVEEIVDIKPEIGSLCTTSVIWKKGLDVTWEGCSGVHDNRLFNRQLLSKYPKRQKIYGASYVIAHANISIPTTI